MQDVIIQFWGVWGAIIVALGLYILRLETKHSKERKEWLSAIERLFDKSDEREKDVNDTIRETGNILTGLKTLFEVQLRK